MYWRINSNCIKKQKTYNCYVFLKQYRATELDTWYQHLDSVDLEDGFNYSRDYRKRAKRSVTSICKSIEVFS